MFLFLFSGSLSTKHNWRHNRHNHGRRQQKWPPSTPHEALCSALTLLMDGWQPPEIADVFFGGVEGVYGPQSAPLFRWWWIATTSECFEGHKHPQQPQKVYRLIGGLLPIHLTCRRRAQGLMWGARGPFTPAAAMVGYGCVGWCWPLEAYVRLTYLGIVNIVYGSIFFIPI